MAYGFLAVNADGRTQITSEDTYSHLHLVGSGNANPGQSNSWGLATGLLFGSGSAGGRMGMTGLGDEWSPDMVNSTSWFAMAPYASPTATGSYGLQVKSDSSTITYDSRYSQTGFSIIAVGVLPAGGSETSVTIDYSNSGFASGDVYCLMNGSTLDELAQGWAIRSCYTHQASNDLVIVENYVTGTNIDGFGTQLDPTAIRDMTYMIVGRSG